MSLVLTASEVMQVLDMDLALASAAEAFRAYGEGRVNMPPKSYLTLARGDFRAMYGEIDLPQGHICGLKWVNVHPGNPARGLLTVMAKILLNHPDTGLEFADLDGTRITDFRTGAAGGLAAEYLARPGAALLGMIGCGAQARTQVAAILKVRPIQGIAVFDRHRDPMGGRWPPPRPRCRGWISWSPLPPAAPRWSNEGGFRPAPISTPSAPTLPANRNWTRPS